VCSEAGRAVGPAFERTVIDHLLEGADGGDRADRAPEIGLFRHALIRPVADRHTEGPKPAALSVCAPIIGA